MSKNTKTIVVEKVVELMRNYSLTTFYPETVFNYTHNIYICKYLIYFFLKNSKTSAQFLNLPIIENHLSKKNIVPTRN